MDEEEQQQSDSKISVSSFFERVDSVDKVANSALSKSNTNFNIINNQKTLINSINVSIEALETKVRDIANYIIIEKKLEKDAEEDRLFEKQDEEQKGSMLERLAGLNPNNESEQTQTAPGEEPKKGGGGILGTLLSLGIGAFAIKFLWPAILPALKGVLAGVFKSVFSWAGLKLGALLGSIIGSIPLIGKYGPKISEGIADTFNGISDWVKNLIEGLKPDGKGISAGAAGGVGNPTNKRGTGAKNEGDEVEKENLVNGDKSMRDTLSEKDLMVTSGTRVDEVGAEGGGKPSSGDLSMFKEKDAEEDVFVDNTGEYGPDKADKDVQPGDIHGIADGLPYNYLQHAKHLVTSRERLFKMADLYPQDKERYLKRAEKMRLKIVDFDKRFPQVTELLKGKDKQYYEEMKNYSVESDVQNKDVKGEIDVEIANKDLDQNLSESFTDKLQPLNEQIETLSEDFTGSINGEGGQMFSRPANSPTTTVTVFKQTSSNSPFTDLMKNNYLSLNKTQQAKLLRYMK